MYLITGIVPEVYTQMQCTIPQLAHVHVLHKQSEFTIRDPVSLQIYGGSKIQEAFWSR